MTPIRRSTGSDGSVSARRTASDAFEGSRAKRNMSSSTPPNSPSPRDLEQRVGVRLELGALARHGCRTSLDGSGLRGSWFIVARSPPS